jgi:hypothetical protein
VKLFSVTIQRFSQDTSNQISDYYDRACGNKEAYDPAHIWGIMEMEHFVQLILCRLPYGSGTERLFIVQMALVT